MIVSGCSTASDDPPPVTIVPTPRPTVPSQARIPCADPAVIPDRDISEAEATTLWGRDRGALRTCEQRRAAAVEAADAVEASP